MNGTYARERVGPAIMLATLPVLAGGLAMVLSLLVTEERRWAAFGAGWLLALVAVLRTLRRRWSGSPRYATSSLFLAACAGVGASFTALALTVQWQDLASQPNPTPTMVILDLIASISPFAASTVAAWAVLGLTDKGVATHSSHA